MLDYQVRAVAAGGEAVGDEHGEPGSHLPHLPEPEVLEQADQVPHRRHPPEGDAPGGGGHPPCCGGGQEDVPSGGTRS